jgi:hypothetical protein
MNKISRKGTTHAAISETNGTIFSSSFKVGIMIETELENADRSVILKCQTFNAQPAFGKLTAQQAPTFNRLTPTIRNRVFSKP